MTSAVQLADESLSSNCEEERGEDTEEEPEEEPEEEVVELSEADLLHFLDSQEPSLQVCSRLFTLSSPSTPEQLNLLSHDQVLELKNTGFTIKDVCLTSEAAEQLHAEALHLHSLGSLQQASQVGLMPDMPLDKLTDVSARGDNITWLHKGDPKESAGFQAMQVLQELQADLHSVMCLEKRSAEYQLAVYMGAGSQYVKHRDALPDDGADPNQRRVTAILYANPHWAPAHGGELRLWLPPDASDRRSSEGALPVISAAPEQHNNGCPATDECAAPDRLNNATALAPALDDRDGLDNASASAATPSNHATTDHHDSCHNCTDDCDSISQLDDTSRLQILTLQDGRTYEPKDPTHNKIRFSEGVHQHKVNGERVLDVAPVSGRLVVFLSGAIDHAVLPSHQPRVALTAWCQ